MKEIIKQYNLIDADNYENGDYNDDDVNGDDDDGFSEMRWERHLLCRQNYIEMKAITYCMASSVDPTTLAVFIHWSRICRLALATFRFL